MRKFTKLIIFLIITTLILPVSALQAEELSQVYNSESTDIVIVGAGLSGLMAGIELYKNHDDINFIILEKTPNIGGSLIATGGAIFATDSEWHKEKNKVAEVEEVVDYFEESSHTDLNEDLIKNVYELSGETFNWVKEFVNLKPQLKPSSQYTDKLYTAWAEGRGFGFYQDMNKYVSSLNMDLRLNSKVTDLIVEKDQVIGVKVKNDDNEYEIKAQKIILATGGFGKNNELMKKYVPNYSDGIMTVAEGAHGDSFKFVEKFGTSIVGEGTMGTFFHINGNRISSVPFMVNKYAKRFVNESDISYRIQRSLAEQEDGEMFLITDSQVDNIETIKKEAAEGIYKEYGSLEELAEDMNLNASILKNEIDNYNEAISNGENPDFGLPVDKAHPILEAPFYAGHAVVRTFGTIPGIKINSNMQVLNENEVPIKNLYAAGELTAGNAFSYQYPGAGIGISYACNSGRLAAIKAAANMN